MTLQEEITRRRTFAVIAHPDAGKTTLTEKLLLFGGAIHVAGAVKSNKIKKGATVRLHGDRASARYLGRNDRHGLRIQGPQDQHPRHPGPRRLRRRYLPHADGRGFASSSSSTAPRASSQQTRNLMEVCRMRQTPGDRLHQQARPPLQGSLRPAGRSREGARASAYGRWPSRFRTATRFKGVYNIYENEPLALYVATNSMTATPRPHRDPDLASPELDELHRRERYAEPAARGRRAGRGRLRRVRPRGLPAGELAPVFFGSAVNNFGVRELLECFVRIAPSPRPCADRDPERGACRGEDDGLRLQDPRQHGSQPPRPHRLPENLLRTLRAQP